MNYELYKATPTGGYDANSHGTIAMVQTFNQVDRSDLTAGVPEPATWALMILGFGGVGALLRRRRREAFAPA